VVIVERLSLAASSGELAGWPFNLPVVAHLRHGGLRFDRPVTFLVGENGTGKSTLIEALASAYGMDVRGGHGSRRYAVGPGGEGDGLLSNRLRLDLTPVGARARAAGAPGFFLRAETAHGVLGAMSDARVPGYGERHLHDRSHGESFLDVITGRFGDLGLYLLDEPGPALSFQSCLALLHALAQLPATGSQVVWHHTSAVFGCFRTTRCRSETRRQVEAVGHLGHCCWSTSGTGNERSTATAKTARGRGSSN
jgi:predicted ATPase